MMRPSSTNLSELFPQLVGCNQYLLNHAESQNVCNLRCRKKKVWEGDGIRLKSNRIGEPARKLVRVANSLCARPFQNCLIDYWLINYVSDGLKVCSQKHLRCLGSRLVC